MKRLRASSSCSSTSSSEGNVPNLSTAVTAATDVSSDSPAVHIPTPNHTEPESPSRRQRLDESQTSRFIYDYPSSQSEETTGEERSAGGRSTHLQTTAQQRDYQQTNMKGMKHQQNHLEAIPRDVQIYLARSLHPRELVDLSCTSHTLRNGYSTDREWKYYCQVGSNATIHTPTAGDILPGTSSSASGDCYDLLYGTGRAASPSSHSSFSVYQYLLPSIGPLTDNGVKDTSSACLVIPATSSPPLTEPPCNFKDIYRALFRLAHLPSLPVTSLLLPTNPAPHPSSAIRASSFDNNQSRQNISSTLKLHPTSSGVGQSMWSSKGSQNKHKQIIDNRNEKESSESDEWLLYRSYAYPLSFLTRLRIKIYQCYYQRDEPIYPPKRIRIRVGYTEDSYHYTSPWYPVEPIIEFQDFFFYDPSQWYGSTRTGPMMLITGSVIKIELDEYVTMQPSPGDNLYFMVLSDVELEGLPLERLVSILPPETHQPPILAALALTDMYNLSSSSQQGPLTHEVLMQLYQDVLQSPQACQSVADYRVESQLFAACHTAINDHSNWTQLADLVADAIDQSPPILDEQIDDLDEDDDGGGEAVVAADAEANAQAAAEDEMEDPHPPALPPSPAPSSGGSSLSPDPIPVIRMYRRSRDMILATVVQRAYQLIPAELVRTIPTDPQLLESRNNVFGAAIGQYLSQLVRRNQRLTEYESYVLICVDEIARGLLVLAAQHAALTLSLRIGELFMARQQYHRAAQVFTQSRIDGRAVQALSHLPQLYPQLIQAISFVKHSHQITYEEVLKLITEISPAVPDPTDASAPIYSKPALQFALLCLERKEQHPESDELITLQQVFEILGLSLLEARRMGQEPLAYLRQLNL